MAQGLAGHLAIEETTAAALREAWRGGHPAALVPLQAIAMAHAEEWGNGYRTSVRDGRGAFGPQSEAPRLRRLRGPEGVGRPAGRRAAPEGPAGAGTCLGLPKTPPSPSLLLLKEGADCKPYKQSLGRKASENLDLKASEGISKGFFCVSVISNP